MVDIIEVPGMGTHVAKQICEEMDIKSQNDTQKLAEAKEIAYKKGFYEGIMIAGKHAGERVEVAKSACQQEMVDAGEAFLYYEPNGLVISRSGDECVVTFSDQWYLTYGEKDWQPIIMDYIQGNSLNKALDEFGAQPQDHVIAWAKQLFPPPSSTTLTASPLKKVSTVFTNIDRVNFCVKVDHMLLFAL